MKSRQPASRNLKTIARLLTPPILWTAARRIGTACRRSVLSTGIGGEGASTYYDDVYSSSAEYAKHYTRSTYYFLWCVLADRLVASGCPSVLDLGCGPGQLASLLRDKGIHRYCGVDFSEQAIGIARIVCPDFTFVVANLLDADVYESVEYDVVVCTEVLEHVDRDLELLQRIPSGKRFYGSVPDFPDRAHVRCFSKCESVAERYGRLFREFRVDSFLAEEAGRAFFLFEGVTA